MPESAVPTALVDTSVLVDVLRGFEPAHTALVAARRRGSLYSSAIVRAEVLTGMRSEDEERTRALLDGLHWHPVDEAVAEVAGALGRRWHPSHSGIDIADLLIAATARLLGLPLLTRNTRHFPMFEGLQPPY